MSLSSLSVRSLFRGAGACVPAALLALLLTVLVGCNDDPVMTPSGDGSPLVNVDMGPDASAFEVRSAMATGPGGTYGGPLIIRGSNLHYDPTAGALVVDLTVTNAGEATLPEPIALVFVDLIPDGVTVLDADNEETGPGAKVFFEFANDDAIWTPGEESFPRTVSFGVEEGVSMGFAAHIEAGMPQGGGRIGGVVWHDANENGERETDEPGIEGVGIVLSAGFGPKFVVETGPNGRYVFEGLGAGTYTIQKAPRDDLEPTTPPVLTVLLVEVEGEVSDFLEADFGCTVVGGAPELEIGDYVHVTGEYVREPHRIIARGVEVLYPPHDEGGNGEPWEGTEGEPWDAPDVWPLGEIRGPVTDIDLADRALQIMGTWFRVAHPGPDDPDPDDPRGAPGPDGSRSADHDCGGWDLKLEDVEAGDRVRARVLLTDATSPDEPHVIVHLKCWNGEREKVRGPIEGIEEGPEEGMRFIRVLRTLVVITPETDIGDGH